MESIRQHAEAGYPYEICGFLIGAAGGSEVTRARATPNVATENRERRYLISAPEQLRVQRECDQEGTEILGYYHSHPDHPAQPSRWDAEPAWPGPVYLIVSVEAGRLADSRAFVATEFGGPFRDEPWEVRP